MSYSKRGVGRRTHCKVDNAPRPYPTSASTHLAHARGFDPDRPRGLRKVTETR